MSAAEVSAAEMLLLMTAAAGELTARNGVFLVNGEEVSAYTRQQIRDLIVDGWLYTPDLDDRRRVLPTDKAGRVLS